MPHLDLCGGERWTESPGPGLPTGQSQPNQEGAGGHSAGAVSQELGVHRPGQQVSQSLKSEAMAH